MTVSCIRHFITYFRRFVEARDLFSSHTKHTHAPHEAKPSHIAADNAPDDDDEAIPETVSLEITDAIDLHSFAPRDIPAVVAAYLDEARARGFHVVRIIHGKGKGVQRAVVNRVLTQTSFVASFTDAPPTSGGWGATMVQLTPPTSHTANESPDSERY